MIYGITENPQPTGKCVKYTPCRLGVKEQVLSQDEIVQAEDQQQETGAKCLLL